MGRLLTDPTHDSDEANVPSAPATQLPIVAPLHSWKTIIMGLWAVGLVAALGAVLLAMFLQSRPIDLRDHSRQVAGDFEELLAMIQVPLANIHRIAEESQSDTDARWTRFSYEVKLPDSLNLSGVVTVIRRNMARYNVDVWDDEGTPANTVSLHLAAAGHEFTYVTLVGRSEKFDLTEVTRRIAEETIKLLGELDPPVNSLVQAPPERRENDETVWEFTAIRLQLDDAEQVASLAGQLHDVSSRAGVVVTINSEPAETETTVTLSRRGLECVRLKVTVSSETASPYMEGSELPPFSQDHGPESPSDAETLPLDSEGLNGDARRPAQPILRHRQTATRQVAIIVDDGGYGGSVTEKVLAMDPVLTLSILPHAPHSAETARRARDLGFEVMLHMPMENASEHVSYPGQITVDMSPEEIHRLTEEALADVPGVAGINNHTGSKFTADADSMRTFLDGIRNRDLFYVDSRTISTSTGFDLAREMGIPCAARDLFLDHESNKKYIRARFRQLIEISMKHGNAIGICHFRRNSVAVLQEMIPEFTKEGIAIVHVSELTE